jgi:aryl-phospho-beta-D-glucosidase BglC (GH1 family)
MATKYGFNFLWMFARYREDMQPLLPGLAQLDFVAQQGFNFVRVPTDYRFWTQGFDYLKPDERIFEKYIDAYLRECTSRGLHMSLNIHRAPGYCINRNDIEKHNLWADAPAQEAFVFLWKLFAKRYKGIDNKFLSFDLLNEPPDIGEYGCTRAVHERLMRRTIAAIRAIDPAREIVLNGLGGGHTAMPELADAGVVHSGRGYQPFEVSHHKAEWIKDWQAMDLPEYPSKEWDKTALIASFDDWREAEALGAKIHIGEFGCYNKTPNDIAMRWLTDLISCWRGFGWGYALWNFKGAFGICEHGREGAKFEEIGGFKIDRALLELLQGGMV